MKEKFVVRGCPFLTVAHYAPADIVEDQCGMTQYDLCADRNDCFLKKIAEAVTHEDLKAAQDLLKVEIAKIYFKI
jgi:hypothetical protein